VERAEQYGRNNDQYRVFIFGTAIISAFAGNFSTNVNIGIIFAYFNNFHHLLSLMNIGD